MLSYNMTLESKAGNHLSVVYTDHQPLHAPIRRRRTPNHMSVESDFLTRTPGHALVRSVADLSGINGYPGTVEEQSRKWGHQPTPLFPETDIHPVEIHDPVMD